MHIRIAKSACFCMGVKRAMDMVLDAAHEEKGPVYTYGPLIHNPQVLEMLKKKNIFVTSELTDEKERRHLIIRTHGISPMVRKEIKSKNYKISDATCPLVAKVQGTIKRYAVKNYHTVIIGDKDHAEIIGLMGFTKDKGHVVKNIDEINALPEFDKVCVVGQTTLNRKKYLELAEKIKEKYPSCIIEETICSATDERQEEVLKLAKTVEAMIVVGGKESSNTKHLAILSKSTGTPTFHIEHEDEIDEEALNSFNSVGITAGASTPSWMIKRVVDRIEEIGRKRRKGVARILLGVMDFSVKSNLYISIGAGFLAYITTLICNITWNINFSLIAFFYFLSMYNLNQLADKEAVSLNKPEWISFYNSHKNLIFITSSVSLFIAFLLSLSLGLPTLALMLFSTVLGVIYSVKLLPEKNSGKKNIRRLKDFPGSKDIFVANAWAGITVLLPAVSTSPININFKTVIAFLFVFMISYIRSVLLDIRDIQGDRLVGRETIPIMIGMDYTKIFLLLLSLVTAVAIFMAMNSGLVSSIGYVMIFSVCYTVFYLFLYHKRIISQGISCEYVVDGTFIITGLTGIIYSSIFAG